MSSEYGTWQAVMPRFWSSVSGQVEPVKTFAKVFIIGCGELRYARGLQVQNGTHKKVKARSWPWLYGTRP